MSFLGKCDDAMTDIFVADNLHLNDKGTVICASAIRDALRKIEAQHELIQ